MGRIRTIKPEFPQSESVGSLSRDARLLFIQLWTIADDSGRTRASSRLLASLLYPYDPDAPMLIGSWLDELEKQEMVRRYTVEENTYLEVCNWMKHQKIDRPTLSRLPAFDEPSRILASSSRALDDGPRTVDHGPIPGTGTHATLPRGCSESIDESMVASAVLTEARLGGRELRCVLEEVCRSEMKAGMDADTLRDRMVAAWGKYDAAKPDLEYTKGAAKFFGDGDWRDSKTWPWKRKQEQPKPRILSRPGGAQ